ncbi:MAG TPA: FxSxx-COOH system tetratricopeptide repeat protein [Chthoniobacterales bacterium]|nr:FxSxx-COOH system tetratricopeptide repeat protein [Chthoniobacterales bacterium]
MAENDPPAKKNFFISYNKADREWAEWVAWHLEESGHYSVAIQAWDFGPGLNFAIEMDRAIQECDRVVAVLSPDYLTSLFTKPEWAAYFAQDPTSQNRRIVPVRVRECELKGLLAPIVFADVVGKPEKEAKATLLDAVKVGRRKPEGAPDFPGRKVVSKPRFPGALPDIWNVPHLRNPNFTEPGQRLTEMRDALCSGKPAALTQALAGLGGVGKTQLAVEYAYRHAADYALVWWVRSEQAATLAADYAALAAALDLKEKDAAEQPIIVTAVREALRHRQDWLLIFDNANGMEEVRPFLPQSRGHVLITSRNPSWRGVASPVQIEKWPVNIAVEFLLKRTGQTDDLTAESIAQELDHLPLALEQAGAYIESAQTTLKHYLALFRERRLDLLKRVPPSTDYPETVATTWELSFQRLERESPVGVALLELCAFLAPDDIPRDVIVSGAEYLPEPLCETVGDGLSFDDAVSAIRRFSLMDVSGASGFSIHRLVQAVVRNRLAVEKRNQWAEAALRVINKAFPDDSDDVQVWKECDRLMPHALTTAEFAEHFGVALRETSRLVNQVGIYAMGRAEFVKAKTAFERALTLTERAFGSDDPIVGIRISNLGSAQQALGDLGSARAAFERVLRIDEHAFGPDHAEVAEDLNNLGALLNEVGDFVGAKAAFERALVIAAKTLPIDHPSVGVRLNNLGSVLQKLGDLPGAKAAFERSLAIEEKSFGLAHPNVAVSVNNLGCLLEVSGDFVGAKAAFERALEIDQNALGNDHLHVGIRLHNLASVLKSLGEVSRATAFLERAVRIFDQTLGTEHPKTQAARRSLASLL